MFELIICLFMEVIARLLLFSWIINILKSKLANDFEYCINKVPKLMLLLERPYRRTVFFILWALSERMVILWLFADNCNDSNCILMYTVSSSNSICSRFYINFIAKLLRSLIFPPILAFREKCTWRGGWRTNNRVGE